jgi:hypothetical protein
VSLELSLYQILYSWYKVKTVAAETRHSKATEELATLLTSIPQDNETTEE